MVIQPFKQPIMGKIEECDSSTNFTNVAPQISHQINSEKLFRNLVLVKNHTLDNHFDDLVSVSPISYQVPLEQSFLNLVPSEPSGKILYRDRNVIWQIYCACTTLPKFQGIPYDQASVKTPYDSLGNFFSSNTGLNFEKLILLLSSFIPYRHIVDELADKIKTESPSLVGQELVYPGIPVRIAGEIYLKQNLLKKELLLQGTNSSVRLFFREENYLLANPDFLQEHYFFVLGIVIGLDDGIVIEVGAVLL